jgi:4-hydroxybenzoate polyprenyltransferase
LRGASAREIALAMCAATGLLGFAYSVNSVVDRGADAPGKNPLAGRENVGVAVGVALAAASLGLLLCVALGSVVPCLVSLIAGTIYSAGPRLKRVPLAGTLLNAPIFAPLLFLARGAKSPSFAELSLLVVFVALLLQNQLLHERADAEEDARAGAITTGRLLGDAVRPAALLIAGLAMMALPFLSPSRLTTICGAAAVIGGALVAYSSAPPAKLRGRHARVGMVFGALTFASLLVAR